MSRFRIILPTPLNLLSNANAMLIHNLFILNIPSLSFFSFFLIFFPFSKGDAIPVMKQRYTIFVKKKKKNSICFQWTTLSSDESYWFIVIGYTVSYLWYPGISTCRIITIHFSRFWKQNQQNFEMHSSFIYSYLHGPAAASRWPPDPWCSKYHFKIRA